MFFNLKLSLFIHHKLTFNSKNSIHHFKGCYDLSLPKTPVVYDEYIKLACVNESQISCLRSYEIIFYKNASLVGKCYNLCPIECTEVQYDLAISSSTFPTEWYAQVLSNNTKFKRVINTYFKEAGVSSINYTDDYAGLKNTMARVNVFYAGLRYTQMKDSAAMTIDSLLGTMGGNLVLFLGKKAYIF
jgi:hypothetical protein